MKNLEKIIKYGIYLSLILPLVFTSRTMYPWHFGKTILFQILVEISLVLALIFFSLESEKKIIKMNKLDLFVYLFLIVLLISSIFGVNFEKSFWGNQQRMQGVFTWFHFGAFYFLIRQFFQTKKDWSKFLIVTLLIGVLSSILAWLGRYLSILPNIISLDDRLSGMIGNPIFFASYLILLLFLSFSLYFWNKKIIKNPWIFIVSGFFILMTILYAQVRGAFVGILVGAFITWIFYLIWGDKNKTKKTLVISGCILLALLGSLFVLNLKSSILQDNIPALSRMLNITPEQTTASTRLMAWKIAWEGFKDKPLLGWGPENFQDAFDKNYDARFLNFSFGETVWDKPHNYFLEVLSTTGVLGAISYFLIVFTVIFYLLKIFKREEDDNKKMVYLFLIAGIVSYVVQNLFAFETSNSLQIWFIILAFISFSYNNQSKDKSNLIKIILPILALGFFVLSFFLVYKNLTFYRASVYMGDARDALEINSLYQWQKNAIDVLNYDVPFLGEQAIFLTKDLSDFDAQGIMKREVLESTQDKLIEIFEREIEKNLDSFIYRFWGGQFYSFLGEYVDNSYYDRANELAREAWDINRDRQAAGLVLAKNYLLQKNTDEALEILEYMIENQGEYSEIHWFYGLALEQKGENDQALEELEKGLPFAKTRIGNVLYMIDIYNRRAEYEKIVDLYKDLIEENPDNASLYASLAATYVALDDEINTIFYLNKAVELDPSLTEEAQAFLKQNNIDINKYK